MSLFSAVNPWPRAGQQWSGRRAPRVRALMRLCVAGLLILGGQHAWAAGVLWNCSGNPAPDTLTAVVAGMPRDSVSSGQPLSNWLMGTADTAWWTCTNEEAGLRANIVVSDQPGGLSPTTTFYTEDGVRYRVYATGIPGVGVVISNNLWCDGRWLGWDSEYNMGCAPNNIPTTTVGGQYRIRLIKTGQIKSGTSPAITVDTIGVSNITGTPGKKLINLAPITFTALSCTVENVNVTLDAVRKSDFQSSVNLKNKAFQFVLRNCPAGMNTINYQLDPLTPVISAADGTFNINTGTGMATGVGLRITDSNGQPLRLGDSSYQITDYQKTGPDNQQFTIPLNVSYYRSGTAAQVTPGLVTATAQLTMYYR